MTWLKGVLQAAHRASGRHPRGTSWQLLKMVELSATPTLLATADGSVAYVNRSFSDQFGYTRDDIPTFEHYLSRSYQDASDRSDAAAVWRSLVERASGGESLVETRERPFACKDGTIKFVVISIVWVGGQLQAEFHDVTELKAYQRQLEDTVHQLTAAQISGQVGSGYRDLATGAFTFSTGVANILGLDPDAGPYSYEDILSFVHPEDQPYVVALTKAIEAGSDEGLQELRVICVDGSLKWIARRIKVVKDEHGRAIGHATSYQDITELKAAEFELRRSKEHLSRAQATAHIGSIMVDLDRYEELDGSDEFYRLFGVDPADRPNRIIDLLERVHPEDRQIVAALRDQTVGGQGHGPLEFRVVLPGGEVRWLQSVAGSGRKSDSRTFIVTFQDITERKRHEAELAEQRAHLALAQHVAGMGSVMLDLKTGAISWSDEFFALVGVDPSNPPPSPEVLFRSIHPDDVGLLRTSRERWTKGEVPPPAEARMIGPEGQIRWLRIQGGIIPGADGKPAKSITTFQDVTALRLAQERLEQLAHQDTLTGLLNRHALALRLGVAIERARRSGRRGAVLLIDLDRFKNVNDSFGHPVGDELLKLIAAKYRRRVRATDTLARMGGDEFIVLMEDMADAQDAAILAQALINETLEPHLIDGREIYVGTSIGISVFPDDAASADEVIRNADRALYQVKFSGRQHFKFHTEELTRAATVRKNLEARLRLAIEQRQFVVHYQPIIGLGDGRILGVEALVRWHDPAAEMVMPDSFIGFAEETGLILPIGDLVLRSACDQAKKWLDQGAGVDLVSVNLSPVQFRQPNIVAMVEGILRETDLPPRHLQLEFTESTVMDFGKDAEWKLERLRQLGIRIAIDDFGVGYSSLAYLKRLPIDWLKLDRGFVRGIPGDQTDTEIVAAVCAMARNLRINVIAEGVETAEQHAFLKQLGCAAAQGFLFGRPAPADTVLARESVAK